MKSYQKILSDVLEFGRRKSNRTGIDTLALPNQHFSHDMQDGFPALTTKKIAWETLKVELEGFIKGITSKKWYQERGCNIWNEWANPVEVDRIYHGDLNVINNGVDYPFPDRKKIQKRVDDLGPIYGYSWRRYGKPYKNGKPNNEPFEPLDEPFDQLNSIIKTLKNNPNDRRMICDSWNPDQLHMMALPPCHYTWELTHIDGELSLHWTQR